jgi:hypothetical protein
MTETTLKERKAAKAHRLLHANEPRLSPFTYDHDFLMALQYYNVNHENKDKRKWVLAAYPKLKFNSDLSDFYYRTLGTLIRIRDNGNDLSDAHLALIESELKILTVPSTKKKVEVVTVSAEKKASNIQDAMDEKVNLFLGEFAGLVDEYCISKSTVYVDKLVNSMGIRGPMIKKVLTRVARTMEELQTAVDGSDKYINEGYSNFKKSELKKLLGIYETLVSSLSQAKVTAVRKTRVAKVKPPAVIAKGVKFAADNTDLGLKSINPALVVNQGEVWMYNAKYRKLYAYKAIDGQMLTWKGSALLNWDTEKSMCKSIRKPEALKALIGQGTRAWMKYFKELTTKPATMNGRCNSETLILTALK